MKRSAGGGPPGEDWRKGAAPFYADRNCASTAEAVAAIIYKYKTLVTYKLAVKACGESSSVTEVKGSESRSPVSRNKCGLRGEQQPRLRQRRRRRRQQQQRGTKEI
ncbi:uncharacterized protein [Dermacentor albipictus]|uniref:uncharacterized protein n=1 Tax=Dermacentor albipictus TaxID=60249 RepID=UPI0038FCBCC6